jgi:hypothetical protein
VATFSSSNIARDHVVAASGDDLRDWLEAVEALVGDQHRGVGERGATFVGDGLVMGIPIEYASLSGSGPGLPTT